MHALTPSLQARLYDKIALNYHGAKAGGRPALGGPLKRQRVPHVLMPRLGAVGWSRAPASPPRPCCARCLPLSPAVPPPADTNFPTTPELWRSLGPQDGEAAKLVIPWAARLLFMEQGFPDLAVKRSGVSAEEWAAWE